MYNLQHAGAGRSAAGLTLREDSDGGRGRNVVRVPLLGHRLFSGSVSVVLAPGSATDAARRVGRFAARRGRSPAAACRAWRNRGAQSFSQGLGVLVLGAARESHFVSGRRLLPVAACTAVLGRYVG